MPERQPKFKDMKVHPEPDEDEVLPPSPSQPNPNSRSGKESMRSNRVTERMTPKARMQLINLEEIDTLEEDDLCNDRERGTLFSVSAYARGSTSPPKEDHHDHRPSADLQAHKGRKAVHAGEKGGQVIANQFSSRHIWQMRMKKKIGKFVDGRSMLIVSVCITIYALIGDDLRLLCTNKPADPWFNAIAIVTLLFFTVEIILSSIGKPDYFNGFFFWLDLLATASIVLDLTWVTEGLMPQDEVDMGGNARSGRTARMGATMGRVVRVLRLMRILKLYRAYFEKITRKAKRKSEGQVLVPGDPALLDDWDNDEEWEEAEKAHEETRKESAVGKKLVSLTTRRVIVMVLVMLMVLPFLRVEMSDVLSTSAAWGADSVWESFQAREVNASLRTAYEDRLLRFIYYHNWFMAGRACPPGRSCPDDFWMHVYWVGFAGRDLATLRQKVELARVTQEAMDRWDSMSGDSDVLYSLGDIPSQASERLVLPWTQHCTFGGVAHLGISLLATELEGRVHHATGCPSDLRPSESARIHPQLVTRVQFDDWHMVFFFDKRPFTREESYLALLATAFICVVLLISTVFFAKDANALVLKPVERMVEKVMTIANDPLIALKMSDAEFELEEVLKYKHAKRREGRFAHYWERWDAFVKVISPPSRTENMETAVLEKTIIKLGSLLALGFGEAGANIVSSNMRGLDSSGVNAMIPGSRVDCIMGSAKIVNFGCATEVLQGRVMKFVNQIAEVVHGVANEYHGAPNRNNGDTFLVIWRTAGLEQPQCQRLADLSIIAFARILGSVHESPLLARYRGHPGLQQRLGSRFRVTVSFGLHSGWAIEGAVGSEFKIDASYLSPNVSITESLVDATRIYGVSLLTSETVIHQCSKSLAQRCRLVDRVIIKGSQKPLELYVLDLDSCALKVAEGKPSLVWNTRQRFRARQLLEMEKRERMAFDVDVVRQLFDFCPQVCVMRRPYTEEFLEFFKMGFRNYEEGEWKSARRFLAKTSEMLGVKDGPSNYLLEFMGCSYDFEAPGNWRGVHPLGEAYKQGF